jgi:hypothetical protein
MPDGYFSPGHLLKLFPRKHLAYKADILMAQNFAVIHNGDPRAFLAPVLQCKQAVVGNTGRFRRIQADAENGAFLTRLSVYFHMFLI